MVLKKWRRNRVFLGGANGDILGGYFSVLRSMIEKKNTLKLTRSGGKKKGGKPGRNLQEKK